MDLAVPMLVFMLMVRLPISIRLYDVMLMRSKTILPNIFHLISVLWQVSEASERFHSRLNAKEKTYLYRIAIPGVSNVFERKYLWYFPETLDIKKMEEAASLLIGTHDFKGFSSIKKTKKSTVRSIYNIEIKRQKKKSRSLIQEMASFITWSGFLLEL